MGSWNGTCGISQISINSGTKVKAFLMLQSEYAHGIGGAGTCYSTAYFRPWFFPVTAEYNDYGSIENVTEDWNSKYMLETFQRWLKEAEVKILGDDAEINSPDIEKFTKLDDVFDCVERGALVFRNHTERFDKEQQKWVPRGGYLKIGMFLVLETVYQDMIAEVSRFMSHKNNSFYVERDAESRKKAFNSIEKIRTTKLTDLEKEFESIRDVQVDHFLGDLIEEHYAFKHYKTILYAPDIITIEDFFSKLEEVRKLSTAMSFLRKAWFPQTGQGSQSEELSFTKTLANSMLQHVANQEAENEKERLEYEKWQKKYEAEEKAKKKKALKKKVKK